MTQNHPHESPKSHYSFKALLSKRYSEGYGNGELKLRCSAVLASAIGSVPPRDVGVVTTNWDPCFWEASQFENIIQLHGLAGEPESIVLPGEFASDGEVAEILDNHRFAIEDQAVRPQVQRMFHGDFRRPLTAALQAAGFWLRGAHTIIAWGLGFHPYDSEVCQLAWDVSQESGDAKQLMIINPCDTDRDVCKFLFSSSRIKCTEFPS